MKKYFIPYELAKQLIELGFSEKTFDVYNDGRFKMDSRHNIPHTKKIIWEQAFEFFREKYNLHHSISILQRSCRYHFKIRTIECESDLKPFGDSKIIYEDGPRKKYKDIELDCLKKLIEIVKIKQHE